MGKVETAPLDVRAQMRSNPEGLDKTQAGGLKIAIEHRYDERTIQRNFTRTDPYVGQGSREHAPHPWHLEDLGQKRHRHRLDHHAPHALPTGIRVREREVLDDEGAVEHRQTGGRQAQRAPVEAGLELETAQRDPLPLPTTNPQPA